MNFSVTFLFLKNHLRKQEKLKKKWLDHWSCHMRVTWTLSSHQVTAWVVTAGRQAAEQPWRRPRPWPVHSGESNYYYKFACICIQCYMPTVQNFQAHVGKQPIARWYFPPEVDYRLSLLPPDAKGLVVWVIEAKVAYHSTSAYYKQFPST